jgi:peptidoglycan hydrolase CwlO-like protein
MGGILESEKLIKETLRKENAMAFQLKETAVLELSTKLKEAQSVIKMMDEDLLLLQKSNEETEGLLKASQPEVHQLKIKLIDANNTILRYKAKYGALKN